MTEKTLDQTPGQNSEHTIVSHHGVTVTRVAQEHYRATNVAGATLDFGRGEGLLTPVELLLAATAGCVSVDVDVVTSRRAQPEKFEVTSEAHKISEDGATRLDGLQLSFDLKFPDTDSGAQAEKLIDKLLQISHDKDCTVSRTIEHETPVTFNRTSGTAS